MPVDNKSQDSDFAEEVLEKENQAKSFFKRFGIILVPLVYIFIVLVVTCTLNFLAPVMVQF